MSRRPVLRVLPLEDRAVPATFTVTSFADLNPTGFDPATGATPSGLVTLRSAILAANANAEDDTIVVPAGMYSLTIAGANEDKGATGDLDVTTNVTFNMTGAVVDATGLGDRVLDILAPVSGTPPTAVINGGTFQNGAVVGPLFSDGMGGGIRSSGQLTLNNVTVSQNKATGVDASGSLPTGSAYGGGIWATTTLAINDSTISGNTVQAGAGNVISGAGFGAGGGLYFESGSVQIARTRVTGNVAAAGAAVGGSEGTGENDATGGGVDIESASASLTDVRIDNNQAVGSNNTASGDAAGGDASGGGLTVGGSSLTISQTTIDTNLAQGGNAVTSGAGAGVDGGYAYGGGLQIDGSAVSFDLKNLTVSGNLARGGDAGAVGMSRTRGQAFGGGVYINGDTSSSGLIGNATITNNEAAAGVGPDAIITDGGGLYSETFDPFFNVGSTLVAGNRAPLSPDVSFDASNLDPSFPAPFTSSGSNLIGISDGKAGFQNGTNNDQVGTAAAPIDALLSPLGFFGGSPRAFVHGLNPGSPARDADFNSLVTTDERGGIGFGRGVGVRSDIGAFEVQIPASVTQVVTGPFTSGQPFTVTATVTDPRFPPTGTVQLFVNGVPAGSGTLDSSGNFTFTATGPAHGPTSIFFTYGGDAAYFGASSNPDTVTFVATSTTAVTASPSPALEGQPITLTATVAASDGSTPAGGVTFFVDGTALPGSVSLDGTGTASVPLPAGLAAGNHTIDAVYSGSPEVTASSGSTSLIVQATTSTAAAANPNPAFPNQPLTLTATVASANSTPTGSVTFSVDGSPVGTVTLDAAGNASLPIPVGLTVGTYTVTADYSPTGFFLSSSAPPVTLAVNPSPTTTTTNVSPNPAFTAQSLTLTTSVTATFGTPTGDVTFNLNGSPAGTATLDAAGNASLTIPAGLAAGTYVVTVDYPGAAAFASSSSPPVTLSVVESPTATSLTLAPSSPMAGTPLTLTAVVTATFGTPTGTVNFLVNGSSVGTAAIDSSGRAVFTMPTGLDAGSYTFRADYGGVAGVFVASSSPDQNITLARNASTTTASPSPNTVFATDPLTLTATVASPGGTPTGTVTFFLNGASAGVATLDATGQAVLSLPNGVPFGTGSYALTATYNGDIDFSSSFAAATTLTVTPVPTRTTLTVTPPTAVQGTAVTLTAGVAFATNTAPLRKETRTAGVSPAILNGTVNFFAGTTLLGSAPVSNGVATLTVTSLPVGTNALSAVFVPATADLTTSTGTATATITALSPPAVREIFAVGTGYGDITVVKVYNADGNELRSFQPFGDNYWCGAVVATADVTGDGVEDVLVTAPLGAGPRVKIYDGVTFDVIADFFAYSPDFIGGASLAAGDLTGDGVAEFVTGAGPGGGPAVNVYSFVNGQVQLLNSFFAYDPGLRSGVTVAVSGGLLATGPGFTAGPQVNVYSGPGTRLVTSFFAGDPNSRDGVNVSLGFDGIRTVLTAGSGAGDLPTVATYDATTGVRLGSSAAFEPGFLGGVTVTTVRSQTGESRTVVGTGLGGGPRVRIIGPGNVVVKDFFAVNEDFRGGVFVG
ncbi:beta strand repeat-containing protein [Limnoglobus roseus]|uniref:VCBS repeat-containing protein n=1 Tax=Limnoglobus roseus TaxID=2598579 RepID=A0A5C1ASQ0_9BACT|nr:Ig-like domain-containing protein [Limnoglobus roseus]QEL21066.1 VCBS repeat-containing protein [Limnoglobus roseus]